DARSFGAAFAASAARADAPCTVMTRPGTFMPAIGTVSKGPTAIATRYEGMGGVGWNVTTRLAPARDSVATGVVPPARPATGTRGVIRHGILNSGSSQQGNASRASVSSNWVKRYACPPVTTL